MMTKETTKADVAGSAMRKVHLRITSFLFLVLLALIIDRTNISLAGPGMHDFLGLTPAMFGFGAGLSFVGEALAAIPSAILARRIGVHLWIPTLMILWGISATALGVVHNVNAFYVVRLFLGITEAGVIPSIMIAASIWFPSGYRARAITVIMAAGASATVIGVPLAASLLRLDGIAGIPGWRWLFLVEGLPVVLLGIVAFWFLPAAPQQARWLSAPEKHWLSQQLTPRAGAGVSRSDIALVGRTTALYLAIAACLNFAAGGAATTMLFWFPKVAHEMLDLSVGEVGKYVTPILFIGILAGYAMGHVSDKSGRRYPFVTGSAFLGCLSMAAFFVLGSHTAFLTLVVGYVCLRAMGPVFTAAISDDLMGPLAARAFGIAVVASNLGQFGVNWLFGWLRGTTSSYDAGMLMLLGLGAVATVASLCLSAKLSPAVRQLTTIRSSMSDSTG